MPDTLMPCPFCQEPIQPLATKCRYCKEVLPERWSSRLDVAAGASNAAHAPSSAASAPALPTAPTAAVSAPQSVAGYGRAFGVVALIAAILAFLVPVVGVLWFSPLAIILGIVAMRGGARGYGVAVLVIVTVNMFISPTFWLNIGAGSTMPGAGVNRMITYINVFGVLGMIFMLFTGRLWTSVAAVVVGLVAIGLYGVLNTPWFSQPSPSVDGRGVQAPPIAGRSSSSGPTASVATHSPEAITAADPEKRRQQEAYLKELNDLMSQRGTDLQGAGHDAMTRYLDSGGDPNVRLLGGNWSLLNIAAQNGYKDVVESVLSRGADINGKSDGKSDDGTPLYWAIVQKQPALALYLIEKGADVNREKTGGWRPLSVAETELDPQDPLTKNVIAALVQRGARKEQ